MNSVPKFASSIPDVIQTEVDQIISIDVQATDDDGDEISLFASVKNGDNEEQLSETELSTEMEDSVYTALFDWTPTEKRLYKIEFRARDEKGGVTILNPLFLLCACSNGGQCDYDNSQVHTGNKHRAG